MSSSLVSVCPYTGFFADGKYQPHEVKLDKHATPKPLSIFTPFEEGVYAVLVLLHGFLLSNTFYSHLSKHIASHGFIVVVPQFSDFSFAGLVSEIFTGADATEDIKCVADIIEWLQNGLQKLLPPQVHANVNKVGLAGHSCGGKDAFALALNTLNLNANLNFFALIGIDPVDGNKENKQTLPKVLTYVADSFNLNMPVMVIGTGLGELKKFIFPPSAPKGVNHKNFYNECRTPACYFVAKDYGHCDMLDDDAIMTNIVMEHGKSREPMRRFVGGAVVSFLKDSQEGGEFSRVKSIAEDKNVPVVLQQIEYKL